MTYILILILILYGVYSFDIRQLNDRHDRYYYFLLIILILISGLGYRMGGDCIGYMREYPQYLLGDGFSWGALNAYPGRQPGWVLLCKICRSITENFWLLKMTQAILYNSMVFYGLKRLTPHRFTAVLFYFILIYFDTNFQILRQAIAMGFFLVAVTCLMKEKWLKYYILIFVAIAFHESAVICLLFPVIKFIRINRTSLIVISLLFVSIIAFIGPMLELLLTNYIPEVFRDKLLFYAQEIETGGTFSFYLNVVLSFVIPLIYVYLRRNLVSNDIIGKGALFYGLLYTVNLYFPIFYRLSYYFIFFFYLLYIDLFYQVSFYGIRFYRSLKKDGCKKKLRNAKYIYSFLIICFLLIKSRFYFSSYGETGMPHWVQYYPYTSVIFKETDSTREQFIHKL